MLLEPSKSQQNGLFHRIVWPGLIGPATPCDEIGQLAAISGF